MAPPALATMIPPKAQTGTSNSNPQPNCATGRGGPPGLAPSFPLRTAARPVRNRISRITGPAREVTANMHSVNSVESFIAYPLDVPDRSEERRVGKECVSTCRSRWSPYHKTKNKTHKIHIFITRIINNYYHKQHRSTQ